MFIPPEMAAYRPRVPGQLSPRTPGAQPGMMGMQPGPLRMPGAPPLSQPPKPPTPGMYGFQDTCQLFNNRGLNPIALRTAKTP